MYKHNGPHLWGRTFILTILASFFTITSTHVLMSTLPIYVQQMGGSKTAAGLIISVFTISAVLFRPLAGNLVDTKGRRVVLLAGIAILILGSFSYAFVSTVVLLLVIRFFHGIGWSAATTASGTVVADIVPPERRGEGIGYYGVASTLAMAVGPSLGLYLSGRHGYHAVFVFSCLLGAIGLAGAVMIGYEGKGREQVDHRDRREKGLPGFEGLVEKTALPTSAVILFIAFTYGGIITFIPSYALYRGIDNAGSFFTVYALAVLAARLFTGRIADKYGGSRVMLPGMLLMGLSLVMLAYALTMGGFLLAGVFYGLGFGAVQPVLNAITVTLAPENRRGAANATFFSAMDVGIGIGAAAWGIVSQRSGFPFVYGLSSVFILLSLAAYFAVLKNKLPENQ